MPVDCSKSTDCASILLGPLFRQRQYLNKILRKYTKKQARRNLRKEPENYFKQELWIITGLLTGLYPFRDLNKMPCLTEILATDNETKGSKQLVTFCTNVRKAIYGQPKLIPKEYHKHWTKDLIRIKQGSKTLECVSWKEGRKHNKPVRPQCYLEISKKWIRHAAPEMI